MAAQESAPPPVKKIRTNKRIYVGAVVPFFNNNPDHTADTKSATSVNIGFKRTFKLFTSGVETGLEYVNEGLSFNSYYFAPGFSKLYDKTFPFSHEIRINELQLPVVFKQSFGKETKNKATPYFAVGWAWRYLMYCSTSIISTTDGIQVYDGKTDISFEYGFPWKHFGSLLLGGFGLQFNNLQTQSALFFEANYKYGISRFHYAGHINTNNLLIHDSNITINVGYKF